MDIRKYLKNSSRYCLNAEKITLYWSSWGLLRLVGAPSTISYYFFSLLTLLQIFIQCINQTSCFASSNVFIYNPFNVLILKHITKVTKTLYDMYTNTFKYQMTVFWTTRLGHTISRVYAINRYVSMLVKKWLTINLGDL
jgi:hypothetical protein